MPRKNEWLPPKAVRELLGISTMTLYRLRRAGKIQFYASDLHPRQQVAKREDVEKLMVYKPVIEGSDDPKDRKEGRSK